MELSLLVKEISISSRVMLFGDNDLFVMDVWKARTVYFSESFLFVS